MNSSTTPDGKRRWLRPTLVVLILIALVILLVLVAYSDKEWPEWTGFGRFIDVIENGKGKEAIESQPRKTLWDLLDLLIVPAILAGGAYWLDRSGKRREEYVQDQQTQETALQNYLEMMTKLLLEVDKPANLGEPVIRSRTLTTLRTLDGVRKTSIAQFLYESGLVNSDKSVINLHGANLNGIQLPKFDLQRVDFHGARIEQANLSESNLSHANLCDADLSKADLTGCTLHGAKLRDATLRHAKLSNAVFHTNPLTQEEMNQLPKLVQNLKKLELLHQIVGGMGSIWKGFDKGEIHVYQRSAERRVVSAQEQLVKAQRRLEVWVNEGRDTIIEEAEQIAKNHKNDTFLEDTQREIEGDKRLHSDKGSELEKEMENRKLELQKAMLERETYVQVDLTGANLEGADLKQADLRWANLTDANLKGAQLQGAILLNASLSGADFDGADLTHSAFSGSSVTLEQLSKAKSRWGAVLDGKELE
jgi:uncharacterized protein YjbI with pentapeptide repeats